MKLNIAVINLQSAVATTQGYWKYPLTGWKYWLPHSHRPLVECGEMLKREHIDIACITEISESSLRTGFRSQTETLSESAANNSTDNTSEPHTKDFHFFSSQKIGKFFFYEGNAILSQHKLSDFISHLMPIELMRMALEETTVEILSGEIGDNADTKKITVFIAHLALGKKARQKQLEMIAGVINEKTGPIIFAGDFNEADPAAFDELRKTTRLKGLATLKTFPSWKPVRSLDYLLYSEEITVLDCHIPEGKPFSDHLPLVVRVEL